MSDERTYAWCFSHGWMHTFTPDREWCTATWAALPGNTEDEAMAAKVSEFGDAQFIHDLSLERQVELRDLKRARRTEAA